MAEDYRQLVEPWACGPMSEVAKTRIFTLNSRQCRSATHPERGGDFSVLTCPEWVNVIALTDDGRVVFVEQFRFGTAEITLEIPGGVVDGTEQPAETCRRELMEESGFAGTPVRMIGRIAANPAMQTNHVHTGLVTRAKRVRESLQLDEHEEIAVRLVPVSDVPSLIRRGVIDHSFVVAAFHFLHLDGAAG
jgi:8-oxo-dGTP pyrophosphatase MutT (NUDIX family)